tara:strand:+ start:626 stop:2002 length:1377 start_codon:yes stop_codon:yes gene_type:complete
MTVTINGDTGISGVNGSAANPAIKGGDADTGIHFGADTAAITTGGTERVSVDSTGAATFSGTVKTSKVENANTSNGGVAIDASGHVQVDGRNYPTSGALSNRNIIINGGCTINQRGYVSGSEKELAHDGDHNDFPVDRFFTAFRTGGTGASEFEAQVSQSTDSPPGHKNSLFIKTTTAESTIGNGEYYYVNQKIEGAALQHLEYGTASAKSLTLSFWVKSSITGTFAASFYISGSGSRSVNRSYTIDTANTWEYKSITIPGDTGNTLTTASGASLRVVWHLAVGSEHNTGPAANAWAAYNTANWAGGLHVQNGVITTANAEFRLSGIQLELGEQATEFEHIPDNDQLRKCQRYFELMRPADRTLGKLHSLSQAHFTVEYKTTKRATPSVISNLCNASQIFDGTTDKVNGSGGVTFTYQSDGISIDSVTFRVNVSPAFTGATYRPISGYGMTIAIDAEL